MSKMVAMQISAGISTAQKYLTRRRIALGLTTLLTAAGAHVAVAQCPFDVAGSGAASLTRDGLLLSRVANGTADAGLVAGTGSTRPAADIRNHVTVTHRARLDVNGDGVFNSTDALIISRYLGGVRGDALSAGVSVLPAIGGPARGSGSLIETYINGGCVLPTLVTVNRPDALVFVDVHEVPVNSVQTSNAVTIAGLRAAAPMSVTDGEYSIGCNGTFTATPATIANGQTVCVRHTAPAAEGSSANTAIMIGGVQGTFVSTTAYAFAPGLQPLPASTITRGSYPAPVLNGINTPTITAVADGFWDVPSTWSGNRVPGANDIVAIAKGRAVTLRGNTASLTGLWIMGSLEFAAATVGVMSRNIMVYGTLQVGSTSAPFTQSATIELTGSDRAASVMGMGSKGLVVMEGGLLSLHGERRLAWTQLTSNAAVGATSVTVKDAPDTWRIGDKLLLAASNIDPRQSEVLTVTNVSGNTVSFSPALQYARYALVQTFNGKRLDQRPTISLLSRNIVLRGDASSDANKFGGHVMSMSDGHTQVSGVEFQRMGQAGLFGRYPIHWHRAGDRAGNFVVNSAVNGSFQRAYVVHSTNKVWVEANVAYNVSNHAFVWSEDGDESANFFIRNVGVLIVSPDEADFAFPINSAFFANSSQGEQRSGVFWGRSFDKHVLRGNVSGGSINGTGFFIDVFTPRPFDSIEGSGFVFENNTAHSTYKSIAIGNQLNYPEATKGHALMVTTGTGGNVEHVFRNYTGYFNTSSAWFEDRKTTFKNSIIADSGVGVMVQRAVIDGVTVVGKSATPVLTPQVTPSVEINSPSLIHVNGSNHGGKRAPLIRDATLVNHSGTGVVWDVENLSPAALLDNLRFVNVATQFAIHNPSRFEYPYSPAWGLNDPTGRMAGDKVPARIVVRDSNLIDARCQQFPNFNAFSCPAAGSLLLRSDAPVTTIDSRGKIAYLTDLGYDYFDPGMPVLGAVSFVADGERYEVLSGSAKTQINLSLDDAAGKSIELSFASASAPSSVTQSGQNVAAASSLAQMRMSTASARFFDAVTQRFFVRIVVLDAASGTQTLALTGNFFARTSPATGLLAVNVAAGLVPGFVASRYANTALYALRYGAPTTASASAGAGASASSVAHSYATLGQGNSDAAFDATAYGTTTVVRALVNAPVDGVYRVALWGDGGGTSAYVDGVYVMGEAFASFNSNFFSNNLPNSEVVAFLHPSEQISLKAGWHEVTLVHGKPQPAPGEQGRVETSLMLRWATPQNPNLWVFPALSRAAQ